MNLDELGVGGHRCILPVRHLTTNLMFGMGEYTVFIAVDIVREGL